MIPSGGTKSPTPPTPSWSSTKSLAFDGVDDYVSCGTSLGDLIGDNYNGSLSASLWFKRNSNTLGGLINFTTSSWGEFTVLAYVDKIRFAINAAAYYIDYDSTAGYVYDTDWHHLAVVMTPDGGGTTDIKMYFDGQLLTIIPSGSSPISSNLDFAGKELFIGTFDASSYSFDGYIDEVSFFTSELTAVNVTSIYNLGTPNDLTSLSPTAWYRMGENSTFKSPQILMPEQSNKDKVSNYSMAFDGVNDSIDCGQSASILTNTFTVSCWVNAVSFGTWDTIIGCDKWNGAGNNGWILRVDGTEISFMNGKSPGTLDKISFTISGNMNTGTWYQLVAVCDGAGNSELFLNGASMGTSTLTAAYDSNIRFIIGARNTNAGGLPSWDSFNGKIDEVSVFNEVKAIGDIWNGTGQPTDLTGESGLVGYWKMGEEAVFNSTNWLLPNKAQDVFSRYSLDFDGVGDYIDCGTGIGTSFGDGYTGGIVVSLWFKADTTSGDDGLFTFGGTGSYGELSVGLKANYLDVYVANSLKLHHSFTDTTDWHNLVINLDGSATSTNQVYLDGAAIGSTFGPYTALDLDAVTFFIAQYWTSFYPFQGKIDEVSIFNTAKAIGDIWDGTGKPTDLTGESGLVSWWRMGEDATYDATASEWTIPDKVGSNNGTSANMTNDDLTGDAPGVTGNGTSANMTIEDRVGDAPDSENNSLSYNMDAADIVEETP